ncbi:MAG: hypothetical protein RLZZ502_711, partial [Pseudomonadota bacterium]
TNTGKYPAYNVLIKDDAAGGASSGMTCSAASLSVKDRAGNAVGNSVIGGGFFSTVAGEGVRITTIPSNNTAANSTVDDNEVIYVEYVCTISSAVTNLATASGSRPVGAIDNTAQITYYSSTASEASNSSFNFVPLDPARYVRKARVQILTPTVTKTLVWTRHSESTGISNVNYGELAQFEIVVNLPEGDFIEPAVVDNYTGTLTPALSLPALNTCIAGPAPALVADGSATANTAACYLTGLAVSGNDLVPSPAANGSNTALPNKIVVRTPATSQVITAGNNTATFTAKSASNAAMWSVQSAAVSVTMDDPNPSVSKTITRVGGGSIDAGDQVDLALTWRNTDANNPLFTCRAWDVLDPAVYNLATVTVQTTPSNYTYYGPGVANSNCVDAAGAALSVNAFCFKWTGTATTPCSTSNVTGTVRVNLTNTVVAGSSYANVVRLAGETTYNTAALNRTVSSSGTTNLSIVAPVASSKTIIATSNADTAMGSNPPLAVGETVTYEIKYDFPEGVTRSVDLRDVLGSGQLANLRCVPVGGAVTTLCDAQIARSHTDLSNANVSALNSAAVGVFVPVSVTETLASNTINISLGDVNNTPGQGTGSYTLRLTLQVQNTASTIAGYGFNNTGALAYIDAVGTAGQVATSSVLAHVATPTLVIDKTVTPTAPSAGDTVSYSIEVKNTATGANAAPAYDLRVADVLPTTLSGFSAVTVTPSAGNTGSISGQNLSGTITKLDPNSSVFYTFTAVVDALTPVGSVITNTASATASSLPGGLDGNNSGSSTERTGSGGVNNLAASDPATLITQDLSISKTTVPFPPNAYYAIGDEVTYEIHLALPVGTVNAANIQDTLPAELAYVGSSASITLPAGVSSSVVAASGSITPALAGNNVNFALGNLTATGAADVVIRFKAIVKNVLANQNNQTRLNAVSLTYNNPNAAGTLTKTAAGVPTVRVGEPNLDMVKQITAGATNSQAGDSVHYRFTVSNSGTTPAYQAVVREQLPSTLDSITNVVVAVSGGNIYQNNSTTPVTTADAVLMSSSNSNDTLVLSAIDIFPGATLTVDFDAKINISASAGQIISNTVSATYKSTVVNNAETRDSSDGGDDDV